MSYVTIFRSDGDSAIVHGWQGTIQPVVRDAEPYRRLGQTGTELNLLGKRANPSACSAVYLVLPGEETAPTDLNYLLEWFGDCKNDYLELLFYSNDTMDRDNVLCTDVVAGIFKGKYNYDGDLYNYRINLQFTLEAQERTSD